MEYIEFVSKVVENIKDKFDPSVSVSVQNIVKNNSVEYTGLIVKSNTSNISPTIYLEKYYSDYCEGKSFETVIASIIDTYETYKINGDIEVSNFLDYEKIKHTICLKLINYERNAQLLKTVPHRKYLDLAIVYYLIFEDDSVGKGSILVKSNELIRWNVEEKDLYYQALLNSKDLNPICIEDMAIMFSDINLEEGGLSLPKKSMYVISNKNKMFGAGVIIYPNSLNTIGNILSDDYYLIPSSVHEMIALSKSNSVSCCEFADIIRYVNDTALSKEEILSNNFYYYDRTYGELKLINA